ncbi:MAG: hypothetical protein JW776_13110 [Candidatus Lokiarchaeota archaeon]|nr:hypothetical protein [Candidatus Lokiarchaeota archaeon]
MTITTQDYEFLTKKFDQLKNYVELQDFRTFLLFNLIDESETMIQKLMEGGSSMRTLLYDQKGAYIYEYALTKGRLVFYVKSSAVADDITVLDRDKNKDFFSQYLSKFEQDRLFTKQENKIGIVRLSSKMVEVDEKNDIFPKFEVTRIYDDFLSFLFDIGKSKYVFVLHGGKKEPNVIFAISILLSNALNQEFVAVQAYIDRDKECTGQFLKVNSQEFTYEHADEIKESTHSDMYHNQYLLMVHIKSLKPY